MLPPLPNAVLQTYLHATCPLTAQVPIQGSLARQQGGLGLKPAHILQPTCPDPSRAEYGQAMTSVGVLPTTTWHALSTSHKKGGMLEGAAGGPYAGSPLQPRGKCSPVAYASSRMAGASASKLWHPSSGFVMSIALLKRSSALTPLPGGAGYEAFTLGLKASTLMLLSPL